MITFSYNGVSYANKIIVNEIRGRGVAPSTVSTVKIPGRVGVRPMKKEFLERIIEIDFTVVGNSLDDLRTRVNEISVLTSMDEPAKLVFSDESDKFYYAIPMADGALEEIITYGMGTMQFFCGDPLKYKEELVEFPFSNGRALAVNNGTWTAEPVFELTATKSVTHVDVFTDKEYMRVGQAQDVEKPPVDPRPVRLADPMDSLTGWSASSTVEQGLVRGAFSTNGYSFQSTNFGTGEKFHGPAVQRAIPGAPYTHFEVEAEITMNATDPTHLGRVVIELLDTNGNIFARMNMNKRATGSHGNEGVVRIGNETNGRNMILTRGDTPTTWKNFNGIMRIARINNRWEAYIANYDGTRTHVARQYETYVDAKNTYGNPKLAQVRVHMAQWGTSAVMPMAINTVRVREALLTTREQTPVLMRAGEKIIIDHRTVRNLTRQAPIRIDGERAYGKKDFGATFFEIDRGAVPIMLEPADSFTGRVWFRERYL